MTRFHVLIYLPLPRLVKHTYLPSHYSGCRPTNILVSISLPLDETSFKKPDRSCTRRLVLWFVRVVRVERWGSSESSVQHKDLRCGSPMHDLRSWEELLQPVEEGAARGSLKTLSPLTGHICPAKNRNTPLGQQAAGSEYYGVPAVVYSV